MSSRRGHTRPPLVEVTIDSLGSDGDGVARLDGARLYVPFTLPGERVRVRVLQQGRDRLHGEVVARLGGPVPAPAPCPHFGRCGGCRLQHLSADAYRAFKRARVTDELARRRIELHDLAFVAVPPASRRRLRLAWGRDGGRLRLGFRRLRGHEVVNVARCPIARPELVALFEPLRGLLAALGGLPPRGELLLTALPQGVDLLIELAAPPTLADRERLAAFAAVRDLARLCIRVAGAPAEPVAARRPPVVEYGRVRVPVPPGAFLQATAEGEGALQQFVAAAARPGERVFDLFAGLGALSLPVADRLRHLVLIDADEAAIGALAGALAASPLRHVSAARRDLARDPLPPEAFDGIDLVVLDPPRAGAAAQAEAIARSAVPRLVYASCNPASFARDARTLTDAGFVTRRLAVVDQFLYAPEVELAALLERDAQGRDQAGGSNR